MRFQPCPIQVVLLNASPYITKQLLMRFGFRSMKYQPVAVGMGYAWASVKFYLDSIRF